MSLLKSPQFVAALLLCLSLYYAFSTSANNREQANKRYEAAQKELIELRRTSEKYNALQQSRSPEDKAPPQMQGSLIRLVTESAEKLSVEISKLTESNQGTVNVQLTETELELVLNWFQDLDDTHRVRVANVKLRRAKTQGHIDAGTTLSYHNEP
ncbi:MAG: type II secretion system protein GspM [Halioglobus sp.]